MFCFSDSCVEVTHAYFKAKIIVEKMRFDHLHVFPGLVT